MSVSRRDVLVILPAWNEGATIAEVLCRVRSGMPGVDVLTVDDGSSDDTVRRAHAAGSWVVSHPFNLGYGAALQTGYKHALAAGYDFVVQLDADGQHDPADIPRILRPVQSGEADLAIGSRFVEPTGYQMEPLRALGRGMLERLLVACGGPRIADPTSGFQALNRVAFALCCDDMFPSDFPDVDVLLFLHRRGIRINEVSVTMGANAPTHVSMHAGLGAVYYAYKMLLSVGRVALSPVGRQTPAPPSGRE